MRDVRADSFRPKTNPGTSTIGSGAVEAAVRTYDNLELLHAHCHRQIHGKRKADGLGCVPRGAFVKA